MKTTSLIGLSVLAFVGLFLLSRILGHPFASSGVLDWVVLALCACIPLRSASLRQRGWLAVIATVLGLAVLFFVLGLWIMARFFGEGP